MFTQFAKSFPELSVALRVGGVRTLSRSVVARIAPAPDRKVSPKPSGYDLSMTSPLFPDVSRTLPIAAQKELSDKSFFLIGCGQLTRDVIQTLYPILKDPSRQITVMNLGPLPADMQGVVTYIQGDATDKSDVARAVKASKATHGYNGGALLSASGGNIFEVNTKIDRNFLEAMWRKTTATPSSIGTSDPDHDYGRSKLDGEKEREEHQLSTGESRHLMQRLAGVMKPMNIPDGVKTGSTEFLNKMAYDIIVLGRTDLTLPVSRDQTVPVLPGEYAGGMLVSSLAFGQQLGMSSTIEVKAVPVNTGDCIDRFIAARKRVDPDYSPTVTVDRDEGIEGNLTKWVDGYDGQEQPLLDKAHGSVHVPAYDIVDRCIFQAECLRLEQEQTEVD